MKACIIENSSPIAPFGERASELPVLNTPLLQAQRDVLSAVGLDVVEEPPANEAWVRAGSRCWFTEAMLRRFLKIALPDNGLSRTHATGATIQLVHPQFQDLTEALQDLPGPGLHDLAIVPAGADPATTDLPCVVVTPTLHLPSQSDPSADQEGSNDPSIPLGDEFIHQVDHWSHLLRVNLLAIMAWGASRKRAFDEQNLSKRLWGLLRLLLKARSFKPTRLARTQNIEGPGCRIHPTAVVEESVLGVGVEVDAFAVVRGSWLGDGAHVEEHASVNASVVGPDARVGRFALANFCVLLESATISIGDGFQACVFGRSSYLAIGACIQDLCFEGNVRVIHHGHRVDSGVPFLGAAIGHRTRIGNGVRIGYGAEVPNDRALVLGSEHLFLRWPEGAGTVVKQ
jgi:hypothetical protein